ncbi:MAG: glycerol-3-phosphate dehydrogenase/oxidase [Gammaproteobacteria bacterium]|nr:glycerol-3-phosphate dehydrogenase/oxidase [Gammaproteobacteria bacterium]
MSASLRETNIKKLRKKNFDVCIVGGGINGAVSAAALSAQGAKVALIDKGDFASSTSSQSSNLAWGGIKYLETWEFPLVWNLCRSRNHLANSYPSTVKEIRFLTTIERGFRFPPLFIYLGSLLYWVMGRFQTRPPIYLSKRRLAKREPKVETSDARAAIEYSDCYLHDNDARFVFGFVRGSLDFGTVAANYVESQKAERVDGSWRVSATDGINGEAINIRAKVLVNACGPEVDLYNQASDEATDYRHVFSKGVHLVVDRVTETNRILAFFASDGRLFFVIPMGPKTCIGTTDTREPDPYVEVTNEDRDFILKNANEMLKLDKPLTRADIIAERCGVRPLAVTGSDSTTDWVSLSRSHTVEADRNHSHVSIFGGKITDCLNIGEEVAEEVEKMGIDLPHKGHRWYGEAIEEIRNKFFFQAARMGLDEMTNPCSCEPLSERLWRRYGSAAFEMLESIRKDPRNAECMIENAEYLRCEIEQTGRREMITKLEDFLRRRSKISLVVRRDSLIKSEGLREACDVLFGDTAEQKWNEYFEITGKAL